MPLLPASLTEPLWVQFSTLLKDDDRPEFVADHPWGCHRRRIPDRVVFDQVLAALAAGHERPGHRLPSWPAIRWRPYTTKRFVERHVSSADSYIMSGLPVCPVLSVGLAAVIEMVEHVIDRGG